MRTEIERPVLFPDLPESKVRRTPPPDYPRGIVARRDTDMVRLAKSAGTLEGFSPSEKEKLERRFIKKKSFVELAKEQGVSPSTASRRTKKIMNRLVRIQDNPLDLG